MSKQRAYFMAFDASGFFISNTGHQVFFSNLTGLDALQRAITELEQTYPGKKIIITAFNEIPSE